jgi:peptidoglycan/xylan/chitin deacetylase (PgdA/CDA1 family)
MSLHKRLGDIRRQVWCSLSKRTVPLEQKGPIVSFTFDDFPRSAYLTAAPILESCGARGTYYVSMSLMNTVNELGEQFRMEDLLALTEMGHELGSHTFRHLSAQKVSCADFARDVKRGEEALCKATGRPVSRNFAYPYGETTLTTKRRLGPGLRSCRGTCQGLNGPRVDLNLLRANPLYGDIDAIKSAEKLIEACEIQRSWLIFYSHDVSDHPSPYGCTPELLEAVCSFAAKRSVRFLTVDATLSELSGGTFSKN